MKMTLLILAGFVFTSSVLFAQIGLGVPVYDGQAHPLVMASHVQNAHEAPMAQQRELYAGSPSVVGQGERPLWEFAPKPEIPLGDVARMYREQRTGIKKAVKVLEK